MYLDNPQTKGFPMSCWAGMDNENGKRMEIVEIPVLDRVSFDLNELILEGFRPLLMKLFFGKMENVMITIGLTNQLI